MSRRAGEKINFGEVIFPENSNPCNALFGRTGTAAPFRRVVSQPEGIAVSFSEQLSAAIAAVKTFQQVENLSREIIAAWGARLLDDDATEAAQQALAARKRSLMDDPRPAVRKAFKAPPRHRVPRSPDRAKSLARRRACATSGAVPSRIACRFTTAETAVLAVIAGEVGQRGACILPIDAVAALAGTSRSVVKRALREAKALGLITVTERPRPGMKHLPNVVKIISPDWRAWIDRGPKRDRHENHILNKAQGPENRGSLGSARKCGGGAPPSRPAPGQLEVSVSARA